MKGLSGGLKVKLGVQDLLKLLASDVGPTEELCMNIALVSIASNFNLQLLIHFLLTMTA